MFRKKTTIIVPIIENWTYIEKCSTTKYGLKLLDKCDKITFTFTSQHRLRWKHECQYKVRYNNWLHNYVFRQHANQFKMECSFQGGTMNAHLWIRNISKQSFLLTFLDKILNEQVYNDVKCFQLKDAQQH